MAQREWVISIQQKLDQGGQVEKDKPWRKHSIYKVPSWIKDTERPNDDRIAAYVPQIISFGPYHHGQSHLQQMEAHKWRVLNHMLNRKAQNITLYLTAVQELEHKARACYDSPVSLTSNEFVELMVLDGCFVLEFLRRIANGYDNDIDYWDNDPVFYKDSICHVIAMDLMKLENQIPLMVLRKLLEIQSEDHATIEDVLKLVLSVLTPRWVTISAPTKEEHLDYMQYVVANEHGSELVHCLDVFRKSLIYKHEVRPRSGRPRFVLEISGEKCLDVFRKSLMFKPEVVRLNTWCGLLRFVLEKIRRKAKTFGEHFMASCISDLKEAGIKFKPRYKRPFWKVEFNKSSGVLEIYPFKIDNATETVLRNLIAFEQCHISNSKYMVITDYVALMDKLIDTASDVAYLHEAGIIVHYLGSDQEVADLFNRLVKKAYVNKKMSGLHNVYQELNEYRSNRMNWWRASLQHDYLSNPWVIISIFGALLLFLLTAIQTGYTVFAYYKPPS